MMPRDEAALALYQANRKSPEIEALMDQFFNFPTREEYADQLRKISEEMSCPEISTSPSLSPSSAASSLEF